MDLAGKIKESPERFYITGKRVARERISRCKHQFDRLYVEAQEMGEMLKKYFHLF